MVLKDKCVSPNIQPEDIVQLKVWVKGGKDNTSPLSFVYDPKGPTQSFKISGATLNNSLEYLEHVKASKG